MSPDSKPTIRFDEKRAREAVAVLETALAATADPRESSVVLMELVQAASAANEWQIVERAAQQLLDCVLVCDLGWMYGNAIYYGNTSIGRAALRRGDVAEAERRLLAAVQAPGSPQLSSFGPNMNLAKELVEAGHRKTVLEFLDLCRPVWTMHGDRLDTWKTIILDGRVPDFGANLLY
jgi:hypothetical protein